VNNAAVTLTKIKEEILKRWADVPAAEVSLRIVDYIAGLPQSNRRMLTYRTLLVAAGKARVDDDLLAAVNILVNSPIAVFDAHGIFIDDDDDEFELSPEELLDATRKGVFVHPQSGEVVANYKEKIVPFFTPSSRFSDAS
jgi:hypothetical protein